MEKVDLVNDYSQEHPFFFYHQKEINHTSNIILITTLHFRYELRYTLTPSNIELNNSHLFEAAGQTWSVP